VFEFLQWVASIDLSPNEEAHANVVVTKTDSWTEQNQEVTKNQKEHAANITWRHRMVLVQLQVEIGQAVQLLSN